MSELLRQESEESKKEQRENDFRPVEPLSEVRRDEMFSNYT